MNITIIGAGAVGCALAHELAQRPGAEIMVVEQNERIPGENQSSRNSGVVHAGIYYPPATEPLKARLCVEGNRRLYAFCHKYDVPCLPCGKLVVAAAEYEEEYLDEVVALARANGVPGVEKVTAARARELEPNVRARCALRVPTSGIVEAALLVRRLYDLARAHGVLFITGARVTALEPRGAGWALTYRARGTDETFDTDLVVNAAGLSADGIARLVDPACPHVLEPVRGEAVKFYAARRPELGVRGMNIYPAPYGYSNTTGEKAVVPLAEFHRLLRECVVTRTVGVHLTPTFESQGGAYRIGQTVTVGPIKTVGIGKEDVGTGLRPAAQYLPYVQDFFPGLHESDLELHQAGVMAVRKNGSDFVIERDPARPALINLIGIDSPGLTACLAIATKVAGMVREN
jgi:L-2-hydroxyglutarate oxidase LhgO